MSQFEAYTALSQLPNKSGRAGDVIKVLEKQCGRTWSKYERSGITHELNALKMARIVAYHAPTWTYTIVAPFPERNLYVIQKNGRIKALPS